MTETIVIVLVNDDVHQVFSVAVDGWPTVNGQSTPEARSKLRQQIHDAVKGKFVDDEPIRVRVQFNDVIPVKWVESIPSVVAESF